MKILLNTTSNDMSVGTNRIWIYDLHSYFTDIGVQAYLNDWNNYDKYDAVIFHKGVTAEKIHEAKQQNPNIKCGVITPSDLSMFTIKNFVRLVRRRTIKAVENPATVRNSANFYILGSLEERDYFLKYNKHSFIFPLVEKFFTKTKNHTEKDQIVLSYHGNKFHLHQFDPHLKRALERLHRTYNIKLLAIYNKEHLGEWKQGRPDIPVETIQWDIATIEENLLRSDIGLVPCVNACSSWKHTLLLLISKYFFSGQESYGQNYILRFKSKANAGRAFVYHQLSIPVVTGFIPSMSHLIGTNQNGFLAHTEDGWYYAIEELILSTELRNQIAKQAKEEFTRNYDAHYWARKLYKQIKDI